ncbi:MAG: DPP IV N-terminal domain-containing protein [Gemmatimonadota bacterium]
MRRLAWLLLIAPLAIPATLPAQYFGQNKVQYTNFDFQVLETEHFDVYYYPVEREAALDVARMAERSYARLSLVLRHKFRERKPIILYASHSDFSQTNTAGGDVGEGTGGFTDFLKHRNVLPLTGAYSDVEHVLQHEMAHQFQYDVWSGGKAGAGIQTLISVNPPLWFVEGMAEYLSIGGVDPNTAMWIRDAAAEGKLPTIKQLENDPRIFPYRFGQSILTYIGGRWGDEAIGAILSASRAGSLEGAFRRVIGLDFRQLGDQWRDAMQKQYLPELTVRNKAGSIAQETLTKEKSQGTYHLAPALSPDGTQVAYFSEKDFFFVDMWLAKVSDGIATRRLFKSTWSSNYETFRFINSAASWSPDGKYLAFAAKRGPKDDIVVLDVAKNDEVARINVDLSGVTTPSWSPDGRKLVFTGYDGGLSDLFTVDADGKNLARLTHDKYADLHPVWSPDGKTIAFTTDRGPETNFQTLTIGNFRLALYHLDNSRIELLQGMDTGRNVNPQWSPDGQTLAYVSDRTGVANIFLYELADGKSYQITDFYTGAQGITPLSPVLSWARQADKLAFVYYEDSDYDVYVMSNPRSRKQQPWSAKAPVERLAVVPSDTVARAADSSKATPVPSSGGSALYRTAGGLRRADSLAPLPDSLRPAPPLSMATLMDSAALGLPDTSTFTERKYKTGFTADYVARPSIGYVRDNFGRGFFGGTTVSLSDMLGNKQLVFSGYINGRLEEAQVLAAYANIAHRVNWAVGLQQDPYFWYYGSAIVDGPSQSENTYITQYRRVVLRSAFLQAAYPFSRFRRVEAGLRATNVDDAILQINEPFDIFSGIQTQDATVTKTSLSSVGLVQPSLALVFDNSLQGYVGPFRGRRSRLEIAQAIGGWRYTQATVDYRRYDKIAGPFTFATRAMYFGRSGRDADRFTIFLGYPDQLRGYTSGSFSRNECLNTQVDPNSITGCSALDQLVGTSIAVGNAELRFPILNASLGVVPKMFPPIEGALFYDIGVAWDGNSSVRWSRPAGVSPAAVRTPLRSLGASIRTNVFGIVVLRFDYAKPQSRPGTKAYWTISIGPAF